MGIAVPDHNRLADLAYRYLAQTARETNDECGLEALRVLLGKFNESTSGLVAQDCLKHGARDAIAERSRQLAGQNGGAV